MKHLVVAKTREHYRTVPYGTVPYCSFRQAIYGLKWDLAIGNIVFCLYRHSAFCRLSFRHGMQLWKLLHCSGGRVPTILCGGHECINKLHHFCQADFESSQESIIGTVESMFKRCLTCLLKEQGCFNPETCERLGYRISASGSLVMSASATPAVGSQ